MSIGQQSGRTPEPGGGGFKPISAILPKTKKPAIKTANSERAELIGYFTDELNSHRRGTKYKPLSYSAIAVKLSHLTLGDLYYLKRTMKDAKNPSAYFWWAIKPKKE